MNLPNQLTLFRILLIPVFVGALVYYSQEPVFYRNVALGVFALACLTDALDGYLARRLNQRTVLGTYLDPIADKLLLLSGFLSLSFMVHLPEAMKIPAWVTILVITRDAVILIGSVIIFMTTHAFKAEPLLIGKATTCVQMATLLLALLNREHALVMYFLCTATAALTVLSGIEYIRVGTRTMEVK